MSKTSEEVLRLPRMDGSGPFGRGPLTGRGLGLCTGTNAIKYGAALGLGLRFGYACRRGLGRGRGFYIAEEEMDKPSKESLLLQKQALEERMGQIEKQLDQLD